MWRASSIDFDYNTAWNRSKVTDLELQSSRRQASMAQTDKRTSHTANGDGSMAHTDKRTSHTANGDGVTEPHVKESTVQHVMNWTGN